jgi:hypothetical protein
VRVKACEVASCKVDALRSCCLLTASPVVRASCCGLSELNRCGAGVVLQVMAYLNAEHGKSTLGMGYASPEQTKHQLDSYSAALQTPATAEPYPYDAHYYEGHAASGYPPSPLQGEYSHTPTYPASGSSAYLNSSTAAPRTVSYAERYTSGPSYSSTAGATRFAVEDQYEAAMAGNTYTSKLSSFAGSATRKPYTVQTTSVAENVLLGQDNLNQSLRYGAGGVIQADDADPSFVDLDNLDYYNVGPDASAARGKLILLRQ